MITLFFNRRNVLLFLFLPITFFSACLQSGCVQEKLDISKVSFDDQTYPVVILGGGMAGLTAAVYCSQANIPCLVIEGPKPGGALSQSHSVRNWPGVEQAPGADIVGNLRKQALAGGVTIVNQKVTGVMFNEWPRIVQTQDVQDSTVAKRIKALTVIIAMGTEPNLLGIPGETENWGKGVSNCAVCEGSLYKDKNVAIVGGGDAAITEADYLADIAKKVTIFVRKDFFRAKDIKAKEKTLARPNVEVKFNAEVDKVIGNGSKVTSLVLRNNLKKQTSDFSVDGLFLAIGSRPNTTLFKNKLELDGSGFIVLKKNQETSVRGVYAGGDVSDFEFVQAVTAASDGCKSALQAIKLLKEIGFDKGMVVQKQKPVQQEQKSLPSSEALSKPAESTVSNGTEKKVIELMTEKDFDQLVVSSQQPVVLDVFTTLCGPCKAMMPIVDRLAGELKDKVSFVKVNASSKTLNIDTLVQKLKSSPIQSVPTFIFVKQGKEIDRLVGSYEFNEFKAKVTQTFNIK